MRKNIGIEGRIFRLCIAFFLLGYAFWFQSLWALAGAAFVFFEAFASWCVFYWLIGRNECPVDLSKSQPKSQAKSLPQKRAGHSNDRPSAGHNESNDSQSRH